MSETTTNESNTTLDLRKFGDEVTFFMNDKCPAITTALLKVIASVQNGSSQQ
ncbi:hypothetical protein PN43_18160 [Vibrio anguillarum]|uniref:hypothetical protein n=1 Tax=Vibrio anguillarum TaxID=55601 RepID=UPI001C03F225|nr:hypothetical protein [Vibrio anguillarum]MBT3006461.1 hypothetical protein [Vibrio anguillarum]